MAVSNNPNLVLTTYALGSCLGIGIYDPVMHIAGLLHVMLPDSRIDAGRATARPCMFVDSGVPLLIRSAHELGAARQRMQITVAGGAQIMDHTGVFNIGKRNLQALSELLAQNSLQIVASQVGGLVNRTMSMKIATGSVTLKVSGQPQEIPLWTP